MAGPDVIAPGEGELILNLEGFEGPLDLLLALAERPNRALSRGQLAELLHEPADEVGRAIDIRIVRLRKKLRQPQTNEPTILAVRGQGYQLCISIVLS